VTVVGELGRGAHGVVYRVRRGGQDWAMKVFTDPVDAHGAALVALRREAALLAWVGHPGLPQVHEVGQVGDHFYLIMDLVEGAELSAVLAGGMPPVGQVVELGAQVGEILAAVHQVGLVHRDVKPHNIMVESAGGIRLIDFGTAAWAGGEKTEVVAGTLLYCAPEQSGMIKRPVDARSDLYSLGVVLYDGQALPLVSPDGRFIAVQEGEPPTWEAILAEPAAPVPTGTAMAVYRVGEHELKREAPAREVPSGLILGRAADDRFSPLHLWSVLAHDGRPDSSERLTEMLKSITAWTPRYRSARDGWPAIARALA